MLKLQIEDSGKGEPVVFVHGSWSDLHAWDALLDKLPGYRLIRYSRRGHSGSECPPGQGLIEEDVGDAAAIVESVGTAHVVGNSLGAEIALRLAIARPELVRSVALHEPAFWNLAPDDPAVAALQAGLRPSVELLGAGAWEDGARAFADGLFGPGAWEHELPEALKRVMVANAPTFLDEERAPDNYTVDAARLPEVTMPTLLSTGSETHPALLVVTDRLAAALPHAERATIAGAGHIPHRTHPREYAELLLGFWSSTRAAAVPADAASRSTNAGSAA